MELIIIALLITAIPFGITDLYTDDIAKCVDMLTSHQTTKEDADQICSSTYGLIENQTRMKDMRVA